MYDTENWDELETEEGEEATEPEYEETQFVTAKAENPYTGIFQAGSHLAQSVEVLAAVQAESSLQLTALRKAGCKKIFQERISGTKWGRPELHKMLESLKPEDVVVVWRLDRLARSTKMLLEITDRILDAGSRFISLAEPRADTTSPAGKMIMTFFAGMAEFEKDLIRARTGAGRAEAVKRGVKFGRPSKIAPKQMKLVKRLLAEGHSARDAAESFGVHYTTLYRLLRAEAEMPPDSVASTDK